MIEYLYDAIRATAGTDITIAAEIAEEDGENITENCKLVLFLDDKQIEIDGELKADIYNFTIPASYTTGIMGRYWYCFKSNGNMLCFKQPIYLV